MNLSRPDNRLYINCRVLQAKSTREYRIQRIIRRGMYVLLQHLQPTTRQSYALRVHIARRLTGQLLLSSMQGRRHQRLQVVRRRI